MNYVFYSAPTPMCNNVDFNYVTDLLAHNEHYQQVTLDSAQTPSDCNTALSFWLGIEAENL